MNVRYIIIVGALVLLIQAQACTEAVPTSPPSDAATDLLDELDTSQVADTVGDRGSSDELPAVNDVTADKGGAELVDTPAPPGGCTPSCDLGATCLDGRCIDDCDGVSATELAASLAPGITVLETICTATDHVYGWNVALDGMVYDVRATSEGDKTRVGLWSWNWWEGTEGADAATSVTDTLVNGQVELWQVFPSRFVAFSEDFSRVLWGTTNGSSNGELFITDLQDGTSTSLSAPAVYGGTMFSSFVLTTSNGLADATGASSGYYYHNVLGLGGLLFDGLGTSVGAIAAHKGELLMTSGYSSNWEACNSEVSGGAGQRTFVIPTSLFIERYTAATLPIDLACDGQQVALSAEFEILADGRIATRDLNADFTLAGISVHYWSLSGDGNFALTNSLPISQDDTFSEVRADPHSSKLLLRHAAGYLIVDGPSTQDPVIPITEPHPEPGPEVAESGPDGAEAASKLDAAPRVPTP